MPDRTALVIRSSDIGWVAVDDAIERLGWIRTVGEAMTIERGLELARVHQPGALFAPAAVTGVSIRPLISALRRESR